MTLRLPLCLLLCAATVLGAEFWDAKDSSEWSGEEIEALLKDSPWAITKTIARGAIMGSVRSGPRRRIRATKRPNTITFTVRWLSADPARKVFGRYLSMQGRGKQQIRQAETMLGQADTHFIIMVVDLPANVIAQTDTTEPKLKQRSSLKLRDKFEIEPSKVDMRRGGGEVQMFFYFPRRDDISIEDRKIEFHVRIGSTTIKREFKLSEMLVNGKLAL